jgi:hypothetical protein
MKLRVRQADRFIAEVRMRMPFKYGIASMTQAPHMFVRVQLEIDGQVHTGLSADLLPPKWFTKNPATSYAADLREMLQVTASASELAIEAGMVDSVFELWSRLYGAQRWRAAQHWHPALLWGFGASLVERAAIDAFCRGTSTTVSEALRQGRLEMDLQQMYSEHAPPLLKEIPKDLCPRDVLPAQPRRTIMVRHTVGLSDPISDGEIPENDRLEDGLPQSLEASIGRYGLRYFKIKLSGDVRRDLERLAALSGSISRLCSEFGITLDGNENYHEIGPFRELWAKLEERRELEPLLARLIFVEQPLHRDVALSEPVRAEMLKWTHRPPIIIDESDGAVGSVIDALRCGYAGTSHKNCKGIFKGLANAAVIAHRRQADPQGRYILSGEDLCNIGPVALLQDLAMMATLGIEHVERNGHHYCAGLSMWPEDVQQAVLEHHGDLYHRQENDLVTPRIENGAMRVESLLTSPFGYGFELDASRFTPADEWQPDRRINGDGG